MVPEPQTTLELQLVVTCNTHAVGELSGFGCDGHAGREYGTVEGKSRTVNLLGYMRWLWNPSFVRWEMHR